MLQRRNIKYLFFVTFIIVVITVSISVAFCNKSYAWTITDWRPSVEIKKDIDLTKAKIDEHNRTVNECTDYINKYEEDGDVYTDEIDQLQEHYDKLNDYIEQERPDIEEAIKKSYAAYFAKDLLDEVVGNKIVTDGIFHWGLVTFVLQSEDEEINNLVLDYYDTKSSLDSAISNKENAKLKYDESKTNVENYSNDLISLNDHLNYLNNQLPQILDIESTYGAAGESKIEGTNIFCNPVPKSTVSSVFGEERDGYTHKGVDLSAPEGTPIYCPCDGKIIDTGTTENMGNYFIIEADGGFLITCMHCSHIFVPNSMTVHKGDNIALVGSTGDSTGPHLHFQVELNGQLVDGLNYIN